MKLLALILILVTASSSAQNRTPHPYREFSIIVTKEGYYPKSISVFEGEKVKFYVTSTIEEPNCMIIEAHKVFLAANKGKVTEGEAIFDRPGEFSFYCPGSKSNGKVVVLKKQLPKREIASEKSLEGMWKPKEY